MPLFTVQYHPEAAPGPHDSHYLFKEFTKMMEEWKG
jgi:carbamoyl-phosphate synthase small subunit